MNDPGKPPMTGYHDVDQALARWWLLRYGPNDAPPDLVRRVLSDAGIELNAGEAYPATLQYLARMAAEKHALSDARTFGQYIYLQCREAADDGQ